MKMENITEFKSQDIQTKVLRGSARFGSVRWGTALLGNGKARTEYGYKELKSQSIPTI